jgi:hypothetical protein
MAGKYVWLAVIAIALLCAACDLEGVSQATTHTLSFDLNGEPGLPPDPVTGLKSGERVYLPGESLLHFSDKEFGGWLTERGYGPLHAAGSEFFMPNKDTVLYAFWNDNITRCTVSFDGNGATSGMAPESQQVRAGSSIALPGGSGLAKTGCTFGGWNTNAMGSGANYNVASSFIVTRDITLYAKWDGSHGSTHTVRFFANGGNGTPPPVQIVQAGSSTMLPGEGGLFRSGFSFGGWNTNSSGTGATFPAGSSFAVTNDTSFYAKWNIENNSGPVLPGATLADKFSWLQTNAQSGGDYIIELSSSEIIAPTTLSYGGRNNISITLRGTGSTRSISLSSNGSMFTVGQGVTLTLDENISLVGRIANNVSLLSLSQGSTLIMNDGARISGNNSNGLFSGGGVLVNSNGNFIMNGGIISDNTGLRGGGVVVASNGTFTMNGGTISRNTVTMDGGAICVYYGTFTMNAGIIRGNTSAIYGGGIVVYRGTAIMTGGIISGNTAMYGGGIDVDDAIFRKLPLSGSEQYSGIIYGSEAAGVDVEGMPLRNSGTGSAIYIFSSPLSRNITAGQTDQIDTITGMGLSANGSPIAGDETF